MLWCRMSQPSTGQMEDALFESNLPTNVKVELLRVLKERREHEEAREKAIYLNRILACVLHDLFQQHGEGVVLPVSASAVQATAALLLTQRPIIQLNSLADGGAEVSLVWEPR